MMSSRLDYSQYIASIKARHEARCLGQRIARCRGEKTQEQFAAELKVHVNTLARYERGERLPNLRMLLKLKQLGIDLDWLLADLNLLSEL